MICPISANKISVVREELTQITHKVKPYKMCIKL